MAHSMPWHDGNGVLEHTFYVYTRSHPGSGNFNALNDLKSALFKIAKKQALTFNEEYAIESLWHEIYHGRAKGFSLSTYKKAREAMYVNPMETINQFLARRSYDNFLHSLGGVAKHSEEIYKNGYGYGSYVKNFNTLLERLKITPKDVTDHFRDYITTHPYEDMRGELSAFISAKTGKKTGVKSLIDSLFKYRSDFESELNKFIPAE